VEEICHANQKPQRGKALNKRRAPGISQTKKVEEKNRGDKKAVTDIAAEKLKP